MPLKVNVGLARKVGEPNYSSRGAMINVEMELDFALVSDPGKLRERIRQLFDVVRTSLTEELNASNSNPAPTSSNDGHSNGNGQHSGNGHASNNSNGPPAVRPATSSQINAIHAIARSQQLDLGVFLRERFQRERPEDLTLKEASSVIDELKRKD